MESMSGSVQSEAERCRELRAAEYDSYYHTVLLSVGLKDAFGDDGPCIFKVREPTYSPHPRNPDAGHGRFGAEKGGQLAGGGGGVHTLAGCSIPARDRIEIAALPRCPLGRQEVVELYGDVGVVI